MREDINVNSLHAEVETLKQMLENQNRVYNARAQVDDARATKLDLRIDDLQMRVDVHGNRTTAVETQFAAFFGEQGAFRLVLKKVDAVGEDLKVVVSRMDNIIIAVSGAAITGFLGLVVGLVIWLVEKHP